MQLIIFDFNRTIYDPDTGALVDGASDLLSQLTSRAIPLVLVSRNEGGREECIEELGIAPYFKKILFVEEKTPELFQALRREFGVRPEMTLVVGDYLRGEIRCGNEIGARTVRLRAGKYKDEKPLHVHETPWRTIEHLREVADLL